MNEFNSPFTPGQRWISETEPELGIGILVSQDKRSIKVHFPSSSCHRIYSREAAPLKRVAFKRGDKINTSQGKEICIDLVRTRNNLFFYCQGCLEVCERDISGKMNFSLPQDRLLAGMAGANKEFDLRYNILKLRAGYEKSIAKGFLGGRIDLIDHQFFIAKKVTSCHVPRVLLSDETGLGKTIEACLIIHQLLISHRISRVLIIVPDALVHQWFVELYRKFNLSFQIFNETHCSQAELADPCINPFSDAQQGICSQDFIQASDRRKQQILSAGWDMVIMDEAHHILDHADFYAFMEKLGRKTKGLMLLTATPEQMGIKNHFSQLRLLDPNRYFDFTAYTKEAAGYRKTAVKVAAMIKDKKDVTTLLDTYGPGRVIFRNTRSGIKGFPARSADLIPLKASSLCIKRVNLEFDDPGTNFALDYSDDPRIECLASLARRIKQEKILVICSSKAKVEAIEQALKAHITIDVAKFDETMTLLQRDRYAAWFSRQDGARLLVCSEIGSEGRNFQFVRHLFLFDLPKNPELLEQRIGRVDRIGQKHDIIIHVPYIKNTGFEIMATWYMKGLNLFEKNVNGVHTIYRQFENQIDQLVENMIPCQTINHGDLNKLAKETAQYLTRVKKQLNQGKNILMELNSFKPAPARQLISSIRKMDKDPGLTRLLPTLFDHYGIEMDNITEKIFRLTMDQPLDEAFPALPRNGEIITFDRKTAVFREDIAFLNWDHPYVNQVLDFFITQGSGSCATACIKAADNGIFLETLFVLESAAMPHLNMERFLPREPIRIILGHQGEDCTDLPWSKDMESGLKPDKPFWFQEYEQIKTDLIPSLIAQSRSFARTRADKILAAAGQRIDETAGKELDRLVALAKINPDIGESEISAARNELVKLKENLEKAELRLDALRLIRAQP